MDRLPGDPCEPTFEYRDALPHAPAKGRGAGINPGNRFEAVRLHVLGEFLDQQADDQAAERQGGDAFRPRVPTRVFEDATQTIINRVTPTSDVPFDWTLNPYRGCEHGCVYCFARPYHEYLGFSCGLDFETKIVAKPDAPRMLLEELARPRWRGEPIVMSAITDIYQPIEKHLRIARGCLEVLADCAQPVTTMTKSALVLRDADLWARMSAQHTGRVVVTLVTLDHELAAQLEPRAASPSRRLHVIRELCTAGVDVSVNVAPVIPGLTDREVPAILQAVADAGARRAAWVMLRLPYQLKDVFLDWLQRCLPDRAAHVESLLRQSFDGKLYQADQRIRRRGQGEIAAQIARMFEVFTRRYGLNRDVRPLSRRAFKRPSLHGQLGLFDH
jgi:DNA repair photolyase